jgi:tetratricopeptide (TPR) repeat protein
VRFFGPAIAEEVLGFKKRDGIMRSRPRLIVVLISFCISTIGHAQASLPTSAFSVGIVPSFQVPIADSASSYTLGGAFGVNFQYDFSQPSGILLRGGIDYSYEPYLSLNNESLSLFAFHFDLGYQFAFNPRFRIGGFAGGGYNYGFKNSTFQSGGSLYAEGGLGADLVLTPSLGLSLGGSYRYYAGLLHAASAFLGATYYLTGTEARQKQIESSQPIDVELLKGFRAAAPNKGLTIEKISIASIFPVFRKYYDDHPIGTLTIKNNESTAIMDVSASINIKEYMNDPKYTSIGRIEPGATIEVPIFALFNEHVLDTTEPTKTSSEIAVDYRMNDANYRAAATETVRILDRNAMTWEDNRRAAAFVTSKDPSILTFARNVSGMLRDRKVAGVNDKLLAAFALHEALGQYGLTYVVDPASSYAEQSKKKSDADFLQFPRQTLQYKAGDCDDLSILNAALLEAISIKTAFVTVPGHIFIAFSLGMTPDEGRRAFNSIENLIFKDNDTWVPVEITNIQNGFLPAWRDGAKTWRENEPRGEAGFYPIREAWTVFESVGLPGTAPEIAMPSSDKVLAAFQKETAAFVESELNPQAARLEQAAKAATDIPAARNRLGVLYARYGRYDQAVTALKQALQVKEYAPALVNLANISYLKAQWADARQFYERASKLDPLNPKVLLGIARAAFELEDYATSAKQFDYVQKLDAGLAAKFAYLGQNSTDTSRAASASAAKEVVVWEETE